MSGRARGKWRCFPAYLPLQLRRFLLEPRGGPRKRDLELAPRVGFLQHITSQ